ncbi:pilin glycosylation ligase domain-containing protein, partial [Shigella flexneri]|nr:pilin glycosylation ligase domain-containing protein [Shigella flexneri]ELP0712670.1 pilin glycosylation ligase domain-containing protein [Shigella flexneri]
FPYGIFQQRNVLASWLATGCGVALYLALTARTRSLTLICLLSLYPSVYSFSPYTKPCRPSWFILRHRAGRSRGQTPLARTSP